MRRDAEGSLRQILDGERPLDGEVSDGEARRAAWLKRFGADLEKFDEEAIRRRRVREPGVYGLR